MMENLWKGLFSYAPDTSPTRHNRIVIYEIFDQRVRINPGRKNGNREIEKASLPVDRDNPISGSLLTCIRMLEQDFCFFQKPHSRREQGGLHPLPQFIFPCSGRVVKATHQRQLNLEGQRVIDFETGILLV
jgi:hypothetical protein